MRRCIGFRFLRMLSSWFSRVWFGGRGLRKGIEGRSVYGVK